jgi:hypothetical protein
MPYGLYCTHLPKPHHAQPPPMFPFQIPESASGTCRLARALIAGLHPRVSDSLGLGEPPGVHFCRVLQGSHLENLGSEVQYL